MYVCLLQSATTKTLILLIFLGSTSGEESPLEPSAARVRPYCLQHACGKIGGKDVVAVVLLTTSFLVSTSRQAATFQF